MGIARSSFYEEPVAHDDAAIVEAIAAICDEFEAYGWRRVRAELRPRGLIVNHKKVRRLMREHDLQPRRRRRYVTTPDSDHGQPYPNRTKGLCHAGGSLLDLRRRVAEGMRKISYAGYRVPARGHTSGDLAWRRAGCGRIGRIASVCARG